MNRYVSYKQPQPVPLSSYNALTMTKLPWAHGNVIIAGAESSTLAQGGLDSFCSAVANSVKASRCCWGGQESSRQRPSGPLCPQTICPVPQVSVDHKKSSAVLLPTHHLPNASSGC